jgi:hypothetical protein
MNTICEDPSQCSSHVLTSHWMCYSCIKRLSGNERDPVFTVEQQNEIEKFLDNNKDLMDDLAKAGD